MCHAQILDSAIRRAVKAHRCSSCSRIVEPGTLYRDMRLVSDRRAVTVKQCKRCARRIALALEEEDDDCVYDAHQLAHDNAHARWREARAYLRRAFTWRRTAEEKTPDA